MSSDHINQFEDEMIRLRLEHWLARMKLEEVGRLEETDTKTENDQQNVSSLDAYKKSLECKTVDNASVKNYHHCSYRARKRLQRELKKISEISPGTICACLKENNLFEWEAAIQGPPGTPYEGGTFILDLIFPARYPFMPPKVTFKTKIYHCNIKSDGYISLDVLHSRWSPIMNVRAILLSIQSFFTDCNPDDCLVPEIAAQYVNDREEHDRICREWTKKYAIEEADF